MHNRAWYEPSDEDMTAFIEACLEQGYNFGQIIKECRQVRYMGLREAVPFLEQRLQKIGTVSALKVLKNWKDINNARD